MMKGKKAEFNTQGMLISILVVGLFLGFFGVIISSMSGYYDTTGYNSSEIDAFNNNQELASTLENVSGVVDGVKIDANWFDFFSGMWSKFLAPFKFIYRSFAYLITIGDKAADMFQLDEIFKQFFTSVILVLVIVGIVLIKFGLGRKK